MRVRNRFQKFAQTKNQVGRANLLKNEVRKSNRLKLGSRVLKTKFRLHQNPSPRKTQPTQATSLIANSAQPLKDLMSSKIRVKVKAGTRLENKPLKNSSVTLHKINHKKSPEVQNLKA